VGRSLIYCLFILVFSAPASFGQERHSHWRTLWHASQALLAGANAADIATSWDKSESNPLLRTGAHFSYASLGIKLGVVGGSLVMQHFVARKAPETIPFFASANLAAAAGLGYATVHNARIPAGH
jgi:hypothetical protein